VYIRRGKRWRYLSGNVFRPNNISSKSDFSCTSRSRNLSQDIKHVLFAARLARLLTHTHTHTHMHTHTHSLTHTYTQTPTHSNTQHTHTCSPFWRTIYTPKRILNSRGIAAILSDCPERDGIQKCGCLGLVFRIMTTLTPQI
jgi:hypothetical protein